MSVPGVSSSGQVSPPNYMRLIETQLCVTVSQKIYQCVRVCVCVCVCISRDYSY